MGVYINADDIKKSSLCNDLEATIKAEEHRWDVEKGCWFIETALSSERNIKLLKKTKMILLRCIYVLTDDYEIILQK